MARGDPGELNWPVANALARANGHLPGPVREFGVMRLSQCQQCSASMVENTGDGRGVTGGMAEKPCKR